MEKENRLNVCFSKQKCEGYLNTIDTAGVTLVCQTQFTEILLKIDIFTSLL